LKHLHTLAAEKSVKTSDSEKESDSKRSSKGQVSKEKAKSIILPLITKPKKVELDGLTIVMSTA
jgi:hypothetical protein